MNNIDRTKEIQFTMEVAKDALEVLDLKLTFDKEHKRISVDIFAKATNCFNTYLPAPVFLGAALKTFLKVLHNDSEEFVIFTTSLKNAVSSIRNI